MNSILDILKPLKSFALAGGLAAAVGMAAPIASAQSADAEVSESRGHHHRGRRARHHRGRRMAAELNLTDAQRAQLREYRESARPRMQAAREAGDREAMRALHREMRERFQSVLTPEQRERAQELRREHAQRRIDRRVERMTERLELSATQQQQVRGILQGAAQQRRALHEQARLDGEAPREAMQALRERTRTQVQSVLTSEQQSRAAELREQRRERRGERGERRGRRGHRAR
ncbi:MAG: Spy/CpxP family protein refolding chaperone [Myxococcota bacterium]|nr:Spy/CpxP family protein refolding chaperone [Myxococcota bacterium]